MNRSWKGYELEKILAEVDSLSKSQKLALYQSSTGVADQRRMKRDARALCPGRKGD
jgi:hypothetical protein